MKLRKAILKTFLMISLACAFCVCVYYYKGSDAALTWVTAYILEYSLSVDNLFVFLMIFSYFGVPKEHQNKVLTYGILGAIVFRGIFIFAGVKIITLFHWVIYVLGAFLIFTGIKMSAFDEKAVRLEKNIAMRLANRFMRVIHGYLNGAEGKFFVKILFADGKKEYHWYATPLFITLLVIETTDIMFAVDSVPAILALTNDPFIVYTSNIFAVIGLRQLYFVLEKCVQMFKYLKTGISFVLIFIGIEMLFAQLGTKIPTMMILEIICFILGLSIIISLRMAKIRKKISKAHETTAAQ